MKSRFIHKGKFALVFIGFVLLVSVFTMLLWNSLIPTIFGLPEITIFQAIGLLVLFRFLVGNFGHGWRRERRLGWSVKPFQGQAASMEFCHFLIVMTAHAQLRALSPSSAPSPLLIISTLQVSCCLPPQKETGTQHPQSQRLGFRTMRFNSAALFRAPEGSRADQLTIFMAKPVPKSKEHASPL